jgi:hypothetical protein
MARQQCPRCERWGELVDTEGQLICEDCYGRLSALERTPPTAWNVTTGAFVLLGRLALPAIAIVGLSSLPLFALRQMWWSVPPLADWALSVLLQGVFLHMAQRSIREQPLMIERSVRAAWESLLRLLKTSFFVHFQVAGILFLAAIAVLVIVMALPHWTALFFVIPIAIGGSALSFWRASSLAIALPAELHEHPPSALHTSTRRMAKHRPAALLFALCGIAGGAIPAVSWLAVTVVQAVASLGLGVDLGPIAEMTGLADLAASVTAGVLGLLTTTVSALLYAKTSSYRIY